MNASGKQKTPRAEPSRPWPQKVFPKREAPRIEIAGAKPVFPASQSVPWTSVPSPQTGPLPISRWGINEPQPSAAAKATEAIGARAQYRLVRFELLDPDARTVFLAGTFNDWDTTATQMGLGSHGKWVTDLSLAPGRYEYLYVADGKWVCDPNATDYVPNPFGGCNSVVQVE